MKQPDCAYTIESGKGDNTVALSCLCPLCAEEISLDLSDSRVPARWRGALAHRDKWSDVSEEFRASRSIEEAAARLSISAAETRFLLNFLCMEICGCRLTTCVSCLDDYRSEL